MHTFIAISEIKERAEAIGLTVSGLAVLAGVNPSTALRQAKGDTEFGWIETNKKLVNALKAEEERVGKHLEKLKGTAA